MPLTPYSLYNYFCFRRSLIGLNYLINQLKKMKNLKLICCVCLFLMLMSCGDGSPEVKPLSMGEKIELKDVNVSLVSLETTKAIQSKDGRIIKAEDGKIIYIATFELENKTAETIYASDFGGGLYKKGSVKGDATVSTEIPGVMLSADILTKGQLHLLPKSKRINCSCSNFTTVRRRARNENWRAFFMEKSTPSCC